jgi:surface protein
MWVDDNGVALSTYGEINIWDVSLITNMQLLFKDKTTFNDDISSWDVSNVTNMNSVFQDATSFNQDLSSWNVSNVEGMYAMFDGTDGLSDENKCAIHNSWSVQSTEWPYDWDSFCGSTTINVPADYSTIQEGIDAASDGDTVLVSQGTYTENLILEKEIVLASHAINDNLNSDWTNNENIQGTIINGVPEPSNPGFGMLSL